MTAYRDKSGTTWVSSCRFKDANGTPKRTTKRGFSTKEEAEDWERRLKSEANIRTLTLSEFFRVIHVTSSLQSPQVPGKTKLFSLETKLSHI